MVQLIPSPSKKRIAPMKVVGIIVQQKVLSVCFEGYIVSRYRFANDVPRNGFKYIHCDWVDPIGYLIIIPILGSSFVCTFSPCLNVRSFI
jgi:fructose-specific phosphotransferase system IIC component